MRSLQAASGGGLDGTGTTSAIAVVHGGVADAAVSSVGVDSAFLLLFFLRPIGVLLICLLPLML